MRKRAVVGAGPYCSILVVLDLRHDSLQLFTHIVKQGRDLLYGY